MNEEFYAKKRDCYRLPCSQPVAVVRQNEEIVWGRMLNFSDGGMLFASDEHFRIGEKIMLFFDTSKAESVFGTVCRTGRGKYKHRTAVTFGSMSRAQKDRFYKFIVEQQIEQRRRLTKRRPYL